MSGLDLARHLAWAISLDQGLDFAQARDQVRDFYSGSRAIQDAEVQAHLLQAPTMTDAVADGTVVDDFLEKFTAWIMAHPHNSISDLGDWQADFSQGTTQAFDSFYLYFWQRRMVFFHGEYFYHVLSMMQTGRSWAWIHDPGDLDKNDALIISVPFCDTGSAPPDLDIVLDRCDQLGVPVLVDCAYWPISQGSMLDLDHECIQAVTFSLSKTFPCGHARIGVRYTRSNYKDGQHLHQRIGYNNRLSAALGRHIITGFPADFITTKYRETYHLLCARLGLTAGQSVLFADGDSTWCEYGRRSILQVYGLDLDPTLWRNRICLTRLLENMQLVLHLTQE